MTDTINTNTIHESVAMRLAMSLPSVVERVIELRTEAVLASRVNSLTMAVEAVAKIDGDLKRVRPGNVQYDGEGKVAGEFFTKDQVEEKKKLTDRREKITKALSAAMEKNDNDSWAKLNQCVS